jgi:hypothetical protein
MVMNLRTCFFSLALFLPAWEASANDSQLERNTLRGLAAFSVVVDPPGSELQDRGLTVAAMQTEVEQRLLKAGLRVDNSASEFVGIRIIAAHGKRTDFAVCVMLGVYQAVCLRRNPKIITAAPTWTAESVLLVPPRQFRAAWMDSLDQLVDQFANAWKAANTGTDTRTNFDRCLIPSSTKTKEFVTQ